MRFTGVGNAAVSIAVKSSQKKLASIALGRKLYFDTRLSADGTVACAVEVQEGVWELAAGSGHTRWASHEAVNEEGYVASRVVLSERIKNEVTAMDHFFVVIGSDVGREQLSLTGCLLTAASFGACGGGDATTGSTVPGSVESSDSTSPADSGPVDSSDVRAAADDSGASSTTTARKSSTTNTSVPKTSTTIASASAAGATTTTIRAAAGTTTTVRSTVPPTPTAQPSATAVPPVTPSPTVPATPAPTTPPTPAPTTTTPPVPTTPPTRSVTVDAADPSPPVITVAFGTQVVLTIVSVTEQEFHVHGYDLTKAGTTVTFAFTADLHGSNLVESHSTEKIICTIVVN